MRGQKVAVITYTKAARDEIIRRTQFDPVIAVSTIHSFAWTLIEGFNHDIREWLRVALNDDILDLQAKEAKGRAGTKASAERLADIASKQRRLARLDTTKKFVYSPDSDNRGRDSLNHAEVLKLAGDFVQTKLTLLQILRDGYLNRALIDLGCSVDFSKPAPDFVVRGPGNYEFNIEAVVSDQPPTAKQQKTFNEKDFKTRGALKLAGKIKDKLDLYRGSNGKKHPYSSMSHVGDRPFVIAIAPFDSDFSLLQNNELINMVLFGLAPPVLEGPDLGKQDKITYLLKPSGARVEMGIFTNDAFKEISAVFFSTVGTFGKAVVESKIDRLVRATRYRVIDKDRIEPGSKFWQVGTHRFQLAALNYLLTQRRESEHQIGGADMLIQHSSFHRETHLDGLQVYFNPYAEVPFDPKFPWPAEIARNYYDVESGEHIQAHPDGALVSRQVYKITSEYIQLLLENYGFIR